MPRFVTEIRWFDSGRRLSSVGIRWCENEDTYEDVMEAAEAKGIRLGSITHETVEQAINWCLDTYKLIKELKIQAE